MIVFLRGKAHQVGVGYVDLDVNGVGYRSWMIERDVHQISVGDDVFVYTYHQVREDDEVLYGFLHDGDKEWFGLLLTVAGIGPKGALQIVSATSFDEFAQAIYREDAPWLGKLPGVGKKTAERLVLELKDKMKTTVSIKGSTSTRSKGSGDLAGRRIAVGSTVETDIVEALISLGYNEKQAIESVQASLDGLDSVGLEDGLRLCLAYFDSSRSRGKTSARA